MAHTLTLSDGTNTYNFANPPTTLVLSYTPVTPEISIQQATSLLQDGDDVTLVTRRNVTETIELLLTSTTKPLLQAAVRFIETLLVVAERRQRVKAGARVYLTLQVDGESEAWRTEVLAGRLELNQDALQLWPNVKVEARLHITRRFFWEQVNIAEIHLAALSNASFGAGGRTIHNHEDSGQGNWVMTLTPAGSLPAPAKIQLTNNSGAAQDYRNVYISNNAYSDPANFVHIIQGESARAGFGTTVVDATCSNGNLRRQTGTAFFFKWDLSTVLLADTVGKHFRLLVRFAGYTNTPAIYVTPIVQDATGLVDLAIGDEVLLPVSGGSDYELVDLGALPLPPGGYSATWAMQTLALKFRAATSVTVDLDFVQVTPLDSFRHLIQRGMQILNGDAIIDDGIEGITYSLESGVGHPIYSPRGQPLHVFPGQGNRIVVLHDEGTVAPIANSFSVQVWYRPRRLTI